MMAGEFDDLADSSPTPSVAVAPTANPFDDLDASYTPPVRAKAKAASAKSETSAEANAPSWVPEYHGLGREPAIAGSGILKGLAGAADLPEAIKSMIYSKAGLPAEVSAFSRAMNQPYGSATSQMENLGAVNNPALRGKTRGEELLNEGAEGVGGAIPGIAITGGASAIPQLIAGAGAGISSGELAPGLSRFLSTGSDTPIPGATNPEAAISHSPGLGLPKPIADLIAGVGTGMAGGYGATALGTGLARGVSTLAPAGIGGAGEGPLAALGAMIPGKSLTPNPAALGDTQGNIAQVIQGAHDLGVDIPAPLWNGGTGNVLKNAEKVPPAAIATAHEQYNQALKTRMGLPPGDGALDHEDIQQALHTNGQTIGQIGARTGVNAQQGLGLQTDMMLLQRRFGQELANPTGGPPDPALATLNNIALRIQRQAAQGPIPGDQYLTMTQKGSPLYQAQNDSNSVISTRAGQIRDALENSMEASSAPGDMAALRQARSQYRVAKTLEGPVLNTDTTGAVNPIQVRNAIKNEYGGTAPRDLDTITQAGAFLPPLTNTGTIPKPATFPSGSKFGTGLAGLAGMTGAGAVNYGGPLLSLLIENPAPLWSVLGIGGTGLLTAGGKALLGAGQKAYGSTSGASQAILRLIRGEGPFTARQGALAGAGASLPFAVQGEGPGS
jgi:hypothetical protein